MRLFVFGYGYAAQAFGRRLAAEGWTLGATARSEAAAAELAAAGVQPALLGERDALTRAVGAAHAILVTAPPGAQGCPGLAALAPALATSGGYPDWIGYLSSTGVYGDRGGGWVFERSALAAASPEGARRVGAERDWLDVARGMGLTLAIFRLPGIYGPGRSAFDRLRAGTARRVAAPGQVFSRIHVDDLAAGLVASLRRPRAGGIYNLCDDEPAPNSEVIAHAAGLLGLQPPPEVPLSAADRTGPGRRFYTENKRVSNALAKAELGWRPAYPSYREGLAAILATERADAPPQGELARSD